MLRENSWALRLGVLMSLPILLLSACSFEMTPTTSPTPVIIIATVPPTSTVVTPTTASTPVALTPQAGTPEATPVAEASQGVLATVKARSRLICGINGHLPGFSKRETNGTYSGMDADFCRAVAIAIFGAPNVEFREVFDHRFDAVRLGEVDVVFANSTNTFARDVGLGIDFGPTIFHDGQGILVPKGKGINQIADLNGKTVCVEQGTTSLENLPDIQATYGISFTTYVTDTTDATYAAYTRGLCNAVTSDRSQLAGKRIDLGTFGANPSDHLILGDVLSREPLAPFFKENDSQWAEVVTWAVNCTIAAEELEVNQQNVTQMLSSTQDPRVKRLLGMEQLSVASFGLPRNFALRVIEQLGNYKDIYTRNLLDTQIIPGDRGPNKAWNSSESRGGVLSAPPFR